MPVRLPQISRREFIKRASLAGAGLGFMAFVPPKILAGQLAKPGDQHTFALFSDTHIAADATTVTRDVNMADHLAACVRELQAWPVNPAAVIINGDLALKAGLPGDYATFGKLIGPLRTLAPIHLNLGNHDERENFWRAFPHDAVRLGTVPDKQCAMFASPRANWFMLDSLKATNSTPGELGQAQFYWLSKAMLAHPDKPAIIVAHHNLNNSSGVSGLVDSAIMEELFSQFPQIKAFIFGHTHEWSVTEHSSGVHLINLPPTAYAFHEGQPSGWVRCTLARDGMEIELRSLDTKHPAHGQIKQIGWRR